jgi:DNA-binding CsgD family transcriptional regulator
MTIPHEEGIVLADMSFTPLAMDQGAIAILTDLNRQRGEDGAVTIPRDLVIALQKRDLRNSGHVRIQVQGQRQAYRCRACFMEPRSRMLGGPVLTLHFRRISSAADAIRSFSETYGLTPREEEVLAGISTGLTSKELAERMNISPNTVKTYLNLIMRKLDVTTRAGIVGKLLNNESPFK